MSSRGNPLKIDQKMTPYVVLLIGIFAVSSSSILIRYAQSGVPSLVIAAYRLFVAALVIFPIIILQYREVILKINKNQIILFIFSGIFLALHFATWISSLEYTSIASSVVLVTTTPIWVAIFSPIILKEKTSFVAWIGILITLLGSIIVSTQDSCEFQKLKLICELVIHPQSKLLLGDFLAICGAWAAAGYMMIGRKIRKEIPVTVYIFFVYSIASILLIISCLLIGIPLIGYSGNNYLWLILLGLIPQLLGHSSFNYALGYLPASFVSVALLGEPVGTIILALLLLGEKPEIGETMGGILIIGGILFITLIKEKKRS